jgi:hypothetical protein
VGSSYLSSNSGSFVLAKQGGLAVSHFGFCAILSLAVFENHEVSGA